ncbi:ParA family protein [Halobacterium salinarum]|uniref:ParA family protein n=3 Tax=Halobacterium salinarum TaxID=2242 RepID=UPI002555DBCA|nr:ParA family protein [Halobacterium salinarum]MDL0125681.1 ParA family protein [Halobacterium salinarum]MDL0135686.1 ParA family protein [Halobacterium salinarum]MDL0140733.1 ParA family protein [Halobacterium salinarum]MDL0145733.1 ParA family protein [Halobacterium salinarum]
MDEPAKLAVTNQKGGVGKTMTAINVAGALNDRGRDVLLVDLDPQGAATEGLGFLDAYDAEPPSLLEVLTEPDRREEIADLIVAHDEMDVVPSNIDMAAAERELTLSRRGGEQLALALEEIEADYDYILIDCPPYLGYLTDNGLYAAQNILIPALAESTSKRALELLFDHVEMLEAEYETTIAERGVVANRVEETNEAEEMMAWFDEAFPDIPVWEVRKRVAFQRAFSAGESIFAYDEDLDMAEVFLEVAASLDDQFGVVDTEVAR